MSTTRRDLEDVKKNVVANLEHDQSGVASRMQVRNLLGCNHYITGSDGWALINFNRKPLRVNIRIFMEIEPRIVGGISLRVRRK